MEEMKAEAVAEEAKAVEAVAEVKEVAPVAGVKEVTELLDLVLASVDVGQKVLADGKVGLSDAVLLVELVPLLAPAIDGVTKVPAEIMDLTAPEAAEVVTHVMAKLAVDDVKARKIIEQSLKTAVAVYQLVLAIKA